MRALIICLALAVSVVICMAFLVMFAGFDANAAMLASLGLGIFMVAALFAAISALGPKYRPTPLLTPALAGTAAAVMTTLAIIVGSTHFAPSRQSAMRADAPPKVSEPAPAPIEFPGMMIAPAIPMSPSTSFMPSADLPPARMAEPTVADPVEAPPPAVPPPVADIAAPLVEESIPSPNLDIEPEEPATFGGASSSGPPTAAPIPSFPPPPLVPPGSLVLSEDIFDTSRAPPVPNRQAIPNPPLPRTRPCGEAGPACP